MSAQEQFWVGQFGDEYQQRQKQSRVGGVASNIAFFAKSLGRCGDIGRVIELGAGTGQNLQALKQLFPDADLMGVEINESAAMEIPVGYVFRQSIYDFEPPQESLADLAFTKGLLIHVSPDDIGRAYDKLYACSARYILVCEYFSAMETPVAYRGEQDRLWKRDFGREIGERFPILKLLDYGFAGNCGNWPQDNLNWWLWSK